jgi:DNA polymerase I
VPVVASMEKFGVTVDITKVIKAYVDYSTIEAGLISHFKSTGFNVRSDSDTRRLLTHELGFDPGTLDQRVLSGYKEGIIDLVLYYRQSKTRRNNFLKKIIRGWVLAGRPDAFSIYPRYNQAGRAAGSGFIRAPRTGRFSSSNPNFQQQPRDLRNIYIAPKGHKWFKYDYSQLELRLAANLSRDKNLISDLLTGDPHGVFRQYIFDTTGKYIERPTAKTANFEKLYFGGDAQLVRILQKVRVFIDLSLARTIGRAHESRYGQYYEYGEGVIQQSRSLYNSDGQAMVRTELGRLRSIPEMLSADTSVRQHGERAAVNTKVQGWAADLVKKVMGMLVPIMNKYDAHLAIQVHDEIDGIVPSNVDLKAFDKEVKECMQSLIVGPVPLLVEGGIGASWDGPFVSY